MTSSSAEDKGCAVQPTGQIVPDSICGSMVSDFKRTDERMAASGTKRKTPVGTPRAVNGKSKSGTVKIDSLRGRRGGLGNLTSSDYFKRSIKMGILCLRSLAHDRSTFAS